jgi:outer membrane immunogenic protein
MMKKIYLLISIVFLAFTSFAQNESATGAQGAAPLSKGQKQLNFGAGFNGNGIPTYIGLDFAVHNDVTVGPVVKVVLDDVVTFGFLGRGDYHFNRLIGIPNNWDFYAGASIGVQFVDNADLDFDIHVGGRWYWSEKWGLNLEFGGGNGYGTSLGVSLKL